MDSSLTTQIDIESMFILAGVCVQIGMYMQMTKTLKEQRRSDEELRKVRQDDIDKAFTSLDRRVSDVEVVVNNIRVELVGMSGNNGMRSEIRALRKSLTSIVSKLGHSKGEQKHEEHMD